MCSAVYGHNLLLFTKHLQFFLLLNPYNIGPVKLMGEISH